jgi:cystathionine beta-lyase
VLWPTLDVLEGIRGGVPEGVTVYGRRGTPTTFALEEAIAELEGAAGAISFPSGLAAIAGALLAFVKTGDHVLVTDNVYGPTRRFCDTVLGRMGIETTYFDPLIGADIAALMKPNTAVVFVETPGSLTFEIQDVPAIAAAAHGGGAKVLADTTWGSPHVYQPFEHGIDVSIIAATKYIVGHSDAMLGTASANADCLAPLRETVRNLGYCAGPDDCYLGQRGLRTLSVRLRQHEASGLNIARWLEKRKDVVRVIHPALEDDPGHALWKRDFTGSCGLFAFILEPGSRDQLAAFVDHLGIFAMGASWGGFESLCLPVWPERMRTATAWEPGGTTMRLHVGLEDVDDLIEDLDRAFARFHKAAI